MRRIIAALCASLPMAAHAAFPSVVTESTDFEDANTATHTITLPSGIVANNLVLCVGAMDASTSITYPSPWVEFPEVEDGDVEFTAGYLRATGGETTLVVTSGDNQRSSWHCFRITDDNLSQAPELVTTQHATTSTPDPASIDPTGGSKDFLWITAVAVDLSPTAITVSGFPSGYGNTGQEDSDASTGAALLGWARRTNAATTEDPGAWTLTASDAGIVTGTFAIHPVDPPVFSVAPAAGDPDITAIPTTFTTDVDSTVEGVACLDGAAAPDATEIKADQCDGGGAAPAHFDEATVGGVADGETFTGLTASTTYDLHFVATNIAGDSAVSSVSNITTDASGSVNISDVDTDEIVTATQTNVVITGTTFGASQGTGSVTLRQNGNSKTLSVDSWSDTSIQVDMSGVGMGVVSGLKYGATDIRVTTNAGPSDDQAITVNPPSGTEYVELSTPAALIFDTYGNESRFHGGTPGTDPTAASQCAWRNVSGPSSVDVNTDASLTVTGTGTFDVDCTDNSGSGGSELYVASYSAHPNCASGSTIVCSLAVQGTPPLFGPTPITDHVLALTQAMTGYDVDDYFVAGDSAASARTLRQLGTVTDTTADLSGAHTNVNEILVTNAVAHASLVKGAWLRIGAGGAPTRVKYVDPVNNLIGVWSLASGSNLDAINTYANNAGSVSGITVDSGTGAVSGTPTVDATTDLLLYRWTDAAGLISESIPKFEIDVVTIPDVTAGDLATGTATLEALGITVVPVGQYTDAEAANQVLSQTPSSVLWGTNVRLDYSLGPIAPVWVSYARVWMFKEVRRIYLTTTAFKTVVETDIRGSQNWTRWAPGTSANSGSSNMEINVSEIPNVPPLRENGTLVP